MNVYVAAPAEDAAFVTVVHESLEKHGMQAMSRWAAVVRGPENYASMTPASLREAAVRNDADLRGSDVVLVLARDGAGGEMFAEARVALEWGRPLVWVGRPILSAFRNGVVRALDLDDGIRILVDMQRVHAEGARGMLLAHLARSAA